jgi:DNA gyrase subunit A
VVGANTRDTLYVFDTQGSGAATAVHTLPECSDPKEGMALTSATALPTGSKPVAAICLPPDTTNNSREAGYLLFGTRKGMVKKTSISSLPGRSSTPFVAIKLGEDDSLAWVHYTKGSDDVMMISSAGQAIRFSEETVRSMGLAAGGVQGMRIDDSDAQIVGIGVARAGHDLLLLADDGQLKRTALSQFSQQGRNGKGVLAWKSGDLVRLVGAVVGKPEDRAVVHLARAAARSFRLDDAPRRARTGPGKHLFELKEGDRVVDLSMVMARPDIKLSKARKASSKPST